MTYQGIHEHASDAEPDGHPTSRDHPPIIYVTSGTGPTPRWSCTRTPRAAPEWDQRGKFDPELGLRVLERSGVTTFCAPPTLFRSFVLLDLPKFGLSRVRHSVSAGEPMNPEVIKVWKENTGTTIHDGYEQTETVNIVANHPCMPIKPGSMGNCSSQVTKPPMSW